MIALVLAVGTAMPTYAVGEEDSIDNLGDAYEPTEYRMKDERINEWEDRVLIAATEQLRSDGRIYYAYGDYVDELISYFTKKDLDLNKKEAADAIKQIQNPDNTKSGARSGYLYQIGGKPKNADSIVEDKEYDGKLYPEFDETIRYKNEPEYQNSDLYKNNKEYIEKRTDAVYESKSAMREEMKKLAELDRKYQSLLSAKPASADITELTAPVSLGTAFVVCSAALLLLTIATIVFGCMKGTVSILLGMDDESWNRSNSRKERHRIRQISAVILAAVVAIDFTVLCTVITYKSTYGSDNYIENAMDEAGVCQHGYMSFRDDVHEYLAKNKLPQNALDLAMTYRNYRFDYIKGTRSAIKKGSEDVTYRGIQETVESEINLMAYVTKQDSGTVVKGVNDIYSGAMSTSVGMFINKLRNSVGTAYIAGIIMSIISLILSSVMIVFERHNIYKGIGNLAVATLVGTIIWGALSVFVTMKVDGTRLGITDDDVYVTNVVAAGGIGQLMMMLLIISAVITILLLATSKIMQKRAS